MTDFKKLVLGNAGKKRFKKGTWDLLPGILEVKRKKPSTSKHTSTSSSDRTGWQKHLTGYAVRTRGGVGEWKREILDNHPHARFTSDGEGGIYAIY
ncbi:MAG: hypothetical protein WC516_09730 [Patescibacteria group bacterium]|jgi:hypothetical protein